jgi:hypothetical protein
LPPSSIQATRHVSEIDFLQRNFGHEGISVFVGLGGRRGETFFVEVDEALVRWLDRPIGGTGKPCAIRTLLSDGRGNGVWGPVIGAADVIAKNLKLSWPFRILSAINWRLAPGRMAWSGAILMSRKHLQFGSQSLAALCIMLAAVRADGATPDITVMWNFRYAEWQGEHQAPPPELMQAARDQLER